MCPTAAGERSRHASEVERVKGENWGQKARVIWYRGFTAAGLQCCESFSLLKQNGKTSSNYLTESVQSTADNLKLEIRHRLFCVIDIIDHWVWYHLTDSCFFVKHFSVVDIYLWFLILLWNWWNWRLQTSLTFLLLMHRLVDELTWSLLHVVAGSKSQ